MIAGYAVLVFFGDVWVFVKLIPLWKMSRRFIKSSKRTNFEDGALLLKKARSLFAVGIMLDVLTVYFSPMIIIDLNVWGIIILVFQGAACAAHFGFGVPALIYGNRAAKLFRNLYPMTAKAKVYEKPDFSKLPLAADGNDSLIDSTESETLKSSFAIAKSNVGDFFDIVETDKREPDAAPEKYGEKAGEESEKGEIIQYDDEGYIGTWRIEKSEEQQEVVRQKECPFCGTLNGINNEICDFCGAEF